MLKSYFRYSTKVVYGFYTNHVKIMRVHYRLLFSWIVG